MGPWEECSQAGRGGDGGFAVLFSALLRADELGYGIVGQSCSRGFHYLLSFNMISDLGQQLSNFATSPGRSQSLVFSQIQPTVRQEMVEHARSYRGAGKETCPFVVFHWGSKNRCRKRL